MAACPNCARPLAASADCAACGQERPPASDAMLTPGPAANKDRRRTLLALSPFLLLISTDFLRDIWLNVASRPLESLVYFRPIVWFIALSAAVLAVWHARTEPARLRWGPVIERSARRRDLAWMVFAIALGHVVVAAVIHDGLRLFWGGSEIDWQLGFGGRVFNYLYISQMLAIAGGMVGLVSVVWRLDVAARRRGRAPSRWLRRIAVLAFLSAVVVQLALTIVMLRPSAVADALNADFFDVLEVLMEVVMAASVLISGLCAIGGLVILSLLPAALRSPR